LERAFLDSLNPLARHELIMADGRREILGTANVVVDDFPVNCRYRFSHHAYGDRIHQFSALIV
jgi:hypothetical protein